MKFLDMDIFLLGLFALLTGVMIFAYRRCIESKAEIRKRLDAENLLKGALEKAEYERSRSDNILSAVADGISILDTDFVVVYQNKAHIDMLGNHVGEYCYRAYAGKDGICEGCPVEKAYKDGKTHSEIKKDPGGRIGLNVEINVSPLRDSEGNIIAGIEVVRNISKRVSMENELIANEEKFRSLVESSSDLIWEVDRNGHYTYTSPKVFDMLGYTPDEIIGKTPFDLMPPDEAKRVFLKFTSIASEQKPFKELLNDNLHKDGRIVTLETSGTPVFNNDGEYQGYRGVDRDITERKLIQNALIESETNYRSLAENLPAIVYRVNFREGNKVQFFNSMLHQMTGYKYEKIGISDLSCIEKIIVHEDREHVRNTINSAIEDDRTYNIEYRIVHKDGDLRYFQEHGIPVRSVDGLPLFVDGVIFDITARKKVEDALMQSKLDWEETFDTISDMVTIHDTNFNIIRANKAAHEILKLEPSELNKTLKCYQLYHGKSIPPENCPSCECLSTGKPASFEIYEPHFDKHFEIRAMPRQNTKGKILGVSHVVRDITNRKKAEEEIKKAHTLLEARVNERTAELKNANEQLLVEIGERMQLQHDLEESEKRYRRFFEDSPSSLWEKDFSEIKKYIDELKKKGVTDFREYFHNNPDELRLCASLLKITDINETIVALYGAESKDDFLSNIEQINCDKTYGLFLEEVCAVADKNYILEAEGVTRKFNNVKNHIAIKWSVPAGSEEHLNRVLVSVVDISKRRMAEDLLRKSESKLRAVIESTTDLIWEGDIRTGVLNWIGDIDGLLLYDQNEFPRTISGHMESIHHDDREYILKAIDASILNGGTFSAQYRIQRKDGTYRYWDESGRAVEFEDGKAVRWVGSITDITDKKQAEELLRESEGKFRKLSQEFNVLLDAIPDNLLLLNREMQIVWANKAATDRFLLDDTSSSGKECFMLCCKLPSAREECPTFKCVQTGDAALSKIVSPSGDIFDIRAYPIKDEAGDVKNVIEVISDITSRVKMEEEAKLIQAKLIHTNKMTALGTLVSGVAHEINNPNAFIMSNAELLSTIWIDVSSVLADYHKRNKSISLGGLPYPEVRDAMPKLLKGINEGSNRIKRIIENLKDFSRPEKSNLNEDIDINEVVRVSVSILSSQIKEYTSNFKTHFISDIPVIKGNKQQLEQVIINLLNNSLQSLPDRSAAVRVSTIFHDKMDAVGITIKDEGLGMSSDIIERVTEPFFTTRIDSGGTGLGLSISYAIISDHNGTIRFESQVGKGTTVVIKLPRTGE